jgi:hypothetical protein
MVKHRIRLPPLQTESTLTRKDAGLRTVTIRQVTPEERTARRRTCTVADRIDAAD